MQDGKGSVTFEKGLETSLGLGSFFSIPIGFVYNRVDGFQISDDTLGKPDSPWFYGDCFMPYVMLKTRLPLGPLYLDLFGGAAANWSFVLNPRVDIMEADVPGVDDIDNIEYTPVWGFGYLAGAATGVQLGRISVDIGATWRDIRHSMGISYDADGSPADYPDAQLLLRGISIALSGSYSL